MKKIWLIIKREYLTRIKKKTFIISTLLFPVLYALLIFGSGYMASKGGRKLTIGVIDSSGYFTSDKLDSENRKDSSSVLVSVNMQPDSVKNNMEKLNIDGYIVIPVQNDWKNGFHLRFKTEKTLGVEATMPASNKLNNIWNEVKNEKLGVSDSIRQQMDASKVSIAAININDENASSEIAALIGFISAFVIYLILLIYGSQVMMGVVEEKTNRIAEVMVSSVKPFQLMLGKIIGIGLVAITQFFLWIALIFIVYNITNAAGQSSDSMSQMVGQVQKVFTSINIPMIIFFFVFYFLGGFFFYSSLFAAIGSSINEDMREAQSLSFPVQMPLIFSMIMISAVMHDPSGPVAFWGSIIPFTSPVVMMVRIPFGIPGAVPWWQIGLSMALLVGGFVFTTWFAGKIYRTGILMYGKKPSWKEMIKWAFRRN
ncbi:MAG TPA: ABC transporter permease [Chitinophagaceae bacterium]|jgi:ABC-2 type transport system permease protein|nr:ABC transporter permease [Chitinophagaceae bacterium]HMU59920.1 ABC transporter permease [Chitinophagaceae bacterium]